MYTTALKVCERDILLTVFSYTTGDVFLTVGNLC